MEIAIFLIGVALLVVGFIIFVESGLNKISIYLTLFSAALFLWIGIAAYQPYEIISTVCEVDHIPTYNNGLVSQIRYTYNGVEYIHKFGYYVPSRKYKVDIKNIHRFYFGILFNIQDKDENYTLHDYGRVDYFVR